MQTAVKQQTTTTTSPAESGRVQQSPAGSSRVRQGPAGGGKAAPRMQAAIKAEEEAFCTFKAASPREHTQSLREDMYRGRPPPIGGYPPPSEGRGPPPRGPYPASGYRDERNRPRPPYHPGYHDHGHPDSYRRSPPRRRYPSPASGSHRGGEYWAGGPPRERSLSPRGPVPLDHNLVITVGNELIGPPGSAPLRHHDRSRSRSRGRSFSKAASRGRSKSRPRSRSVSSSSSSSSHSGDDSTEKTRKGFKELQMARRRKELEEMLSLPTKSILKKRNDSEDSPSLRSSDSPRGPEGSNVCRMADQLLLAVKGMEPHRVASMLSELRTDPQMAQRANLDAEIKEILNLLGGQATGAKALEKMVDDIEDEEEFLYGDSEEPKPPPVSEPIRHHGLDLYGDVTEEALYGDYPPQKAAMAQAYGLPLGASPHLQATPIMGEVDLSPDVEPAYMPGMEPLEESERQALEEYEKIQDLLKTIGLDLGVTEISKMAARTKERLHGNKPPPKTPTRCRRPHKDRDVKESHIEPNDTAPPHKEPPPPPHKTLVSNALLSPAMPIPTYPPPQVHGMMPPNFPPPGYSQYGNYLPYTHQQWPPMYPPPNVTMPPQTGHDEFPPTLPYKQPYNKAPPDPGVKGCAGDAEKGKVCNNDRRVSEEQNNESQKQKVLEEREKLKQEREIRMKKKEYLMKELERLRKQQDHRLYETEPEDDISLNVLQTPQTKVLFFDMFVVLRRAPEKKRREKGGHKDPLLQEISHLQEEVMTQISNLRKEHETAEKKRNEIDKVALILGLSPSERPRRTNKLAKEQEDELPSPSEKKKRDAERSPDGRQAAGRSMIKTSEAPPPSTVSPDKPSTSSPAPPPPPEPFEYYDAGNQWCKNCNVTSGSMFDFFTHLHSKTHRKTLDPYDRPWAFTPTKTSKNASSEEKLTKPAKGSEFLLPVRGFFCLLCKEFFGDAICAEEHVTTHAHNEKYKKQIYENPMYEQRRNLDRQAGLASETSGKKRKHEDDEKGNEDKEEKSKHKRRKGQGENKDGDVQKEERSQFKKEEEDKFKSINKEEDGKDTKSVKEVKPSYSKKDEKYRYSREEEERAKHGRGDEDDRYKYSREEECRYRYHRGEGDRYDDRSKYGQREDEDKYKYSKYSDFRSKYDRERDEGKLKAEKEAFKKTDPDKPAGKPEVSKLEPPPKPYDTPKIVCGPSPAMRAKLRKQSQEASKTPSMTTSFAKFTWKKKENVLAKEAAKVAAEFIKEDEAAVKQTPVSAEDSFAKSLAVAKEIAQKLGGQQNVPPPCGSNSANRGRIRPNLPAPAAVLRKATMMGKPAPLNTFLSIRPQNTAVLECPSKDAPIFPDPLTKALNAQNTQLEAKPQPPTGRPWPVETMSGLVVARVEPSEAKTPPPVCQPAPLEVRPAPKVSQLAPTEAKPPELKPLPPILRPAPFEVKPAPPVCKPAPFEVKPAPPVCKPAPFEVKPAPPVCKPAPSVAKPAMIKIVSDVAAPGVPESEQTRTVFVKPPPFTTIGDGSQKSEKVKSNLAAAKAQQLFHIFYSSVGQSGASSITKPTTDTKADGSATNKSHLPTPQAQKPHAQQQPFTQSQPPTMVCTSPQLQSNKSQSPQTNPESDIQIASVAPPTPELSLTPSKTTSETTQPKLNHPSRSEPQSVPQNQSFTLKSESQLITQSKLKPTCQTQSQPKLTTQIQTEPQSETEPKQDTEPVSYPPSQSEAQSVAQNQSMTSKSESQFTPQSETAELEPNQIQYQPKLTPQIQTELQSETEPSAHPETHSVAEPEPKPGPKTRGKPSPTKRVPPAPTPVRQTRSQTRYQTRQQQQSQSEPEPEPASGDSDSAASEPKEVDASDPGSGLQPEDGALSEGDPQLMEITPETLGPRSNMSCPNFEYDYNFE
ncbi:Zinc finger protein 318 [Collichthys lucidus]|uniref:Zinc finger protein 318 n=1 Tax=Collichthys lucidus TaxID=240159 RepID=A0A4U5TUU8_COLLU|nr:Zinc finger protein 318 [Collichthys lucidus]